MALAIHMDLVGGIAGDMFAAAMLDAFPELEEPLRRDLAAAGVLRYVDMVLEPGRSGGLACLRVSMTARKSVPPAATDYPALRRMIEAAPLNPRVAKRALGILEILAVSEAAVHAVPLEQVHFHELADWDSIADIVAAASLIEHSGTRSWSVGLIPMGAGLVNTAHGRMPVPAPAVAELLKGYDLRNDNLRGERVTPTGAAILRHLTGGTGPAPTGKLRGTGTGAGMREFAGLANILRLMILDCADQSETDHVVSLSFDVDDMTPEEISISMERLRAATGVLDGNYAMRFGKKGRSVFAVELLVQAGHEAEAAELCLLETSTLGLRISPRSRRILRREAIGGKPRVKTAIRPDGTLTAKAESDDLAATPTLAARRKKSADAERSALSNDE